MDLKKWLFEAFRGAIGGAIAGPIFGGVLLFLPLLIQEWLSGNPLIEVDETTTVFWCCAIAGVMVRLSTIRAARKGKFD